MTKKTAIIKIKGRVQGVFFRDNTAKFAHECNLTGFVRNISDGSVEIIAEGNKWDIDKLINWCRKGPALAKVEKVNVEWKPFEGRFFDFRVKYK